MPANNTTEHLRKTAKALRIVAPELSALQRQAANELVAMRKLLQRALDGLPWTPENDKLADAIIEALKEDDAR